MSTQHLLMDTSLGQIKFTAPNPGREKNWANAWALYRSHNEATAFIQAVEDAESSLYTCRHASNFDVRRQNFSEEPPPPRAGRWEYVRNKRLQQTNSKFEKKWELESLLPATVTLKIDKRYLRDKRSWKQEDGSILHSRQLSAKNITADVSARGYLSCECEGYR